MIVIIVTMTDGNAFVDSAAAVILLLFSLLSSHYDAVLTMVVGYGFVMITMFI